MASLSHRRQWVPNVIRTHLPMCSLCLPSPWSAHACLSFVSCCTQPTHCFEMSGRARVYSPPGSTKSSHTSKMVSTAYKMLASISSANCGSCFLRPQLIRSARDSNSWVGVFLLRAISRRALWNSSRLGTPEARDTSVQMHVGACGFARTYSDARECTRMRADVRECA